MDNYAVYEAQFHCDSIPQDCSSAEVEYITSTRVRVSGIITIQLGPTPITQFRNNKFLTSTPSLHSILRFSTFPDNGAMVVSAIRNGTAVAVTDASIYSENIAAAAWVIQCTRTGQRCEGRVRALPGSSKMNSYRAEVFGIYTILIAVKQLCLLHNIHDGKWFSRVIMMTDFSIH